MKLALLIAVIASGGMALPALSQDNAAFEQFKAHTQSAMKNLSDGKAAYEKSDFKAACERLTVAERDSGLAQAALTAFSASHPSWAPEKRADIETKSASIATAAKFNAQRACEAATFDAGFQSQMALFVANIEKVSRHEAEGDAAFNRGQAEDAMTSYYVALTSLRQEVLIPFIALVNSYPKSPGYKPVHSARLDALSSQTVGVSKSLQGKVKATCLKWPESFRRLPYNGTCEAALKAN